MDIHLFEYKFNSASIENIKEHLSEVSNLFYFSLASQINIGFYAKKIKKYSFTFECWCQDCLVGLIACYLNNHTEKEGFITNVSVLEEYQGFGIATKLLNQVFDKAIKLNFFKISLDVFRDDEKAISLYERTGFKMEKRWGTNKCKMTTYLKEKEILVSICCVTYNHESFIRQCLDGFLMQKTNFEFEILIHDDASTDGTDGIIREYEQKYPDIIKPIYQTENQYSKGIKISTTYTFPRAKGKYIALCEGDDYWTDPYKLQKQVDFMEENPEYSLCCHRYRIYNQETGEWFSDYTETYFPEKLEGITIDNKFNFSAWITVTLTVVFRYNKYSVSELSSYKYTQDTHLFYHLLKKGKGYCLNEVAAVYRRHAEGIWSGKSFRDQTKKTYLVYKELYMNNKKDPALEKAFENSFVQYYRVVVKPDMTERKNMSRFISFCFEELRYFGLKHAMARLCRLLRKPFDKVFVNG